MEAVTAKQEEIDTKFKLLEITNKRTNHILESGRVRDLNKHLNVLEKKLYELEEYKTTMIETKVAGKEEEGDVKKWISEFDKKNGRVRNSYRRTFKQAP